MLRKLIDPRSRGEGKNDSHVTKFSRFSNWKDELE